MSDNYLRLIPSNPEFLPTKEATQRAIIALKSCLASAENVVTKQSPQIEFVDPGENFEGVFCPRCSAELTEVWPGWMDQITATAQVTSPCCQATSSLNDLHYHWPAGFSQFRLEAMNPDPCTWLPGKVLEELEQILGCPLRQILARY